MTFSNIVFLTPLHIRRDIKAVLRDGEQVEGVLTKDWSIAFNWNDARWRLTVPEGFAAAPSVPKIFRSISSFWGGGFEASVAHDWAYHTRLFDAQHNNGRKQADLLYLALMTASGVSLSMRQRNYLGVRLGGGSHYSKNAIHSETEFRRIGVVLDG